MNELTVAISKPTFYKQHKNYVDLEWGVYETHPIPTNLIIYSEIIDGYSSSFEIDNILLNAGLNKISCTFDYTQIIDGYGKAHGLTAEQVIEIFFEGYGIVDGYSVVLEQEILYDITNRVILSFDGNYYKEIRRSVDGFGIIESRISPTANFTTDSSQQPVGFREEESFTAFSEGQHVFKIDAFADLDDSTTIDGYGIRFFTINETPPVIEIITPIAYDPNDLTTVGQEKPILIYTINGVENPSEISLVNVYIEQDDGYGTFYPEMDLSDGYADGYGFIDGYGDRGRIPSGTLLDLRDGIYVMRIVAQDSAGNIGSAYRRFSFNTSYSFGENSRDIWIGSDLNKENQADSVIEELIIRNTEITDNEADLDYTLGLRGLRFRTKENNRLVFTDEEETKIRQLSIDLLVASGQLPNTLTSLERETRIDNEIVVIKDYLNDANRILLLSNFNIDIEPTDGAKTLAKEYHPVIRSQQSLNELKITVLQKADELIDKDLFRDLIDKIKPTHTNVILRFEEIPK